MKQSRMLALVFLFIQPNMSSVIAFQLTPDPRFKQAVDKATGKPFKDITITDDLRFSSEIRSESNLYLPLLSESIDTKAKFPPRKLVPRKLFGSDDDPAEYWFHNKIHTFGNTNVFGGLHAFVAPLVTRIIDNRAYGGIDARAKIAQDLYKAVNKKNVYIIDLCCGVGMSTRALASAFKCDACINGIDTSPEMVAMARLINGNHKLLNAIQNLFGGKSKFAAAFIRLVLKVRSIVSNTTMAPNCQYSVGNAERILVPKSKVDLVTIFYAFHEIPFSARSRIIREARRLLKPGGKIAIVDICPREYVPNVSMLAGEPYVLEYQKNIEKQIRRFQGFKDLQVTNCIPGHVTMWLMTRK